RCGVAFAVENICGFLIRGGLMTPNEMRAMYQRWQAEAGADLADLPRRMQWLVATDYVTEYQAGLLAQGHASNFFLNQYEIHERGLVHRDIKPANLSMVSPTTSNILDIALAREFFEETEAAPPGGNDLTAEGMLLGTPDYLAPDQARDPRRRHIRADIYSVGC